MKLLLPWEKLERHGWMRYTRRIMGARLDDYSVTDHVGIWESTGIRGKWSWKVFGKIGIGKCNSAKEAMKAADEHLARMPEFYLVKKDEMERFEKLMVLV